MKIAAAQLEILLVGSNLISHKVFTDAINKSEKENIPIEEYLVNEGIISDLNLGQLIANTLGQSYINLSRLKIPEEILQIIPEVVARSRGVIAFAKDDKSVSLGMTDPDDLEITNTVFKRTGLSVNRFFITTLDFQSTVSRYNSSAKDALEKILAELKGVSLSKIQKEASVIKLVDTMMQYGQLNNASDAHFDPLEESAVLRYRIDGILHDIVEIPKNIVEMVVARVKILAKMRTDEQRAAQDGKLTFAMPVSDSGSNAEKKESKKIDVRVSIVPTTHGENIVMRFLSIQNRALSLDDLGFSPADAEKVRQAIKNPVGMILVTGPTGSGKTTTLYGVLKILNKREVNIATVEDPVEYAIEGITQIQVNPKTDLTFANGLRSIVRQDPNIIMVGEIRDHETADIAVNSAMTGHLVLSTLHTNNAATTLPRLLDMGIEPFLIASTINIAVAQRLVRKVCENCRESYIYSDDEKLLIETLPRLKNSLVKRVGEDLSTLRLYKGKGCKVCENTGYVGRIGVFEILSMSSKIKAAILNRASSQEIETIAESEGMTPMFEDGIEKVLKGITTITELLRVASSEY
ncbi:MAG: type II/IV secretion system protein [Parcubacteria group bacterium]|nr:type II/IV secretion system protein [Parcubacteria group bacterium]